MKIDPGKVGKALAVYASAAFVALQAVDLFQDRLGLPDWLFAATLVLLLIGLPIVITTAIVQTNEFDSAFIEKHFTWRRAIGGGVMAFVALAIVATLYARDRFGGDEHLDANLVAVFPFRVSGAEPALQYLSEGMVDLLAAKLSGEAGPRAADARSTLAAWRRIGNPDPEPEELIRAARSLGARRIIIGEVAGNAAQLTISASVTDTRTGRKVQHFVTGTAQQLPEKVDQLAAALLSLDAGAPRDRLASLTSTSLPAVRAYLLGEEAYRKARYTEAGQHYLDALDADSTFALAALGVIAAGSWSARLPPGSRLKANRIAATYRSKLSSLDQLTLTGYVGDKYPSPSTQLPLCRAWDQIIQRAPDRAEAWHKKGDCIYHFWKYTGRKSAEEARPAFEKSMALDSSFLPNIQHLIALAAARRDSAEARRLTAIFLARDSASDIAKDMRWFLAYAQNRPRSELLSSEMVRTAPTRWALDNAEPELADSLLTLHHARLAAESPDGRLAPMTAGWAANLRGQLAQLDRYYEEADSRGRFVGSVWAVINGLYADFDSTAAARRVPELTRFASGPPPDATENSFWGMANCATEQWRLWKGDQSQTDAVIARLEAADRDAVTPQAAERRENSRICITILKAIRATVNKSPDAKRLAIRVDSISAEFPEFSQHASYIRLVASRLLELNGDVERAREAVTRFAYDHSAHSALPAELLQHARLSAKLGDRAAAVQSYRKYLALRSKADAQGARTVEQARRELAAITRER